jgi:hypothetical protein
MEKLSYENILNNITLHQIDSTSLHLLFQRNFTLLINVINYQDFLYGISLPDIHLDLVIYKRCLDLSNIVSHNINFAITAISQETIYGRYICAVIAKGKSGDLKQIQRIK